MDHDGSVGNSIERTDVATTGTSDRRAKDKKERNKRHGAKNQNRHIHFAKWLQARFPDSFQQSNCANDTGIHILDVAGGKGELAARLSMCLQQRVILVDPRPADIAHCFESMVLPKIPNKWQKRINDQRAENPKFIHEKVQERVVQLVTTLDENTLKHSTEIKEAVQNASLLIGLHADGATEAIVDAALEYQKPFVVVPCCVFPSLFPTRKVLMPGASQTVPVRLHDQFCQFLVQKHPSFQLETLPFEGRNVAIWWDGVARSDDA